MPAGSRRVLLLFFFTIQAGGRGGAMGEVGLTGKAAAVCDVCWHMRRSAATRLPSRRLLSHYANEATRMLYRPSFPSEPRLPHFFLFLIFLHSEEQFPVKAAGPAIFNDAVTANLLPW